MPRCWYAYNGAGDVNQPSSYTLVTVNPTCLNGPRLCVINTPDCGLTPSVISTNIMIYIANASSTGIAQPQLPVGTPKFVLMKP